MKQPGISGRGIAKAAWYRSVARAGAWGQETPASCPGPRGWAAGGPAPPGPSPGGSRSLPAAHPIAPPQFRFSTLQKKLFGQKIFFCGNL